MEEEVQIPSSFTPLCVIITPSCGSFINASSFYISEESSRVHLQCPSDSDIASRAHLQSLWPCPSLSKCSDSADHTRLSLSTASQRTFTGGGRCLSWWWLDFAEEEENFHLQQKKKEGKLYECCVFRVCVLLIFVQFISQVFARHKFFYLIIIVHRRVTRPTADALNEH